MNNTVMEVPKGKRYNGVQRESYEPTDFQRYKDGITYIRIHTNKEQLEGLILETSALTRIKSKDNSNPIRPTKNKISSHLVLRCLNRVSRKPIVQVRNIPYSEIKQAFILDDSYSERLARIEGDFESNGRFTEDSD